MITKSRISRARNFLSTTQPRATWYTSWGKRLFDICFSSLVLLLCAPIYLLIAAAIALTSPGPIFFIQVRVGRNNRLFRCIKFRTMVVGADRILDEILENSETSRLEFEETYKLKDDPRITPIGKFLRATSLDEFPQFWNVLMGHMSVVGPRPLVPAELVRYGSSIHRVLTIRPGITGLWQVSGRNDIPYPVRVQIDANYVRRFSFWLDMSVVFKTIAVVLFPKNNGAY